MAELQTEINPQDGQISNDVAGSIRVASQTSGGDIIVTDTKSLNVAMNRLSVKDFGAVGDGLTDDTEAFKRAIAEALRTDTPLYMPSGKYRLSSVDNEGLKCWSYRENKNPRTYGLKLMGAGRSHTQIIWEPVEQFSVLFQYCEFSDFEDFLVTDSANADNKTSPGAWPRTGHKGIIFATPTWKQCNQVTWRRILIYGSFMYSIYRRYTIWESLEDFASCGVKVHHVYALGDGGQNINSTGKKANCSGNGTYADGRPDTTSYDASTGVPITWEHIKNCYANPKVPALRGWNANSGTKQAFFNNVCRYSNVMCEGGELGVYGAVMGLSGQITCQNMISNGDTNYLLPSGEPATGIWFDCASGQVLRGNTIEYYYTEVTQRPIKMTRNHPVTIVSAFWQGYWTGDDAHWPSTARNLQEFITLSESKLTIVSLSVTSSLRKLCTLQNNSELIIMNHTGADGSVGNTIDSGSKLYVKPVQSLETNISNVSAKANGATADVERASSVISGLVQVLKDNSIVTGDDAIVIENPDLLKEPAPKNLVVNLNYPFQAGANVTVGTTLGSIKRDSSIDGFKLRKGATVLNTYPAAGDLSNGSFNTASWGGELFIGKDMSQGNALNHLNFKLNTLNLTRASGFTIAFRCAFSGSTAPGDWTAFMYLADSTVDGVTNTNIGNTVTVQVQNTSYPLTTGIFYKGSGSGTGFGSIPADTWVNFVLVVNSSGSKLYTGTDTSRVSLNGNNTGSIGIDTLDSIGFFKARDTSKRFANVKFKGLRIWNRDLTADEIGKIKFS